ETFLGFKPVFFPFGVTTLTVTPPSLTPSCPAPERGRRSALGGGVPPLYGGGVQPADEAGANAAPLCRSGIHPTSRASTSPMSSLGELARKLLPDSRGGAGHERDRFRRGLWKAHLRVLRSFETSWISALLSATHAHVRLIRRARLRC